MVTPKSGVFLSPDKSFNHLVSVSLNGVEHTDYVIDETQTVALLNNLLIDQKSPYRLFFVWPGQQKAWWGAPEGYGVIALIVEHTKELGPYLDFWRIVGARPNPAITAQHRTNGLKSLEEAGLFSGLEAEQLTIAKKAAAAEPYASFNEMLGCFPNTVVPIRPEALADVEQPYAQLLEQLQAASRGVLEISEVDDRYRQATANAASVHYAFRLGKKRITGKHTADRVMIWTLIDQINEELKRSRQDGRFYPLFVPRPWELDGVNSAYIFLTAKQHQTITEAGWLSFDAERAKLITAEEIEGYEVETRASWTRFHRD